MQFAQWLNEATTDRILVYHGTSPKHFRSIMSQGLIPNPKKRAWANDDNTSFFSSSRVSLEGVYVTTNLMTAISSASNAGNKGGGGALIVIAEVQPKTGFMDEDNLNVFSSVSDNEYIVAALYGAINKNPQDEFVQQFFEKFKDKNYLFSKLNKKLHPDLLQRLDPMLWDLFVAATKRQAAYVGDWTFRKAFDYQPDIQMPNKVEAEQEFLKAKEAVTKTLKIFANPFHYEGNPFNFTSRIMQPIGFSGPNKIVAVVYRPRDYKSPPEVWYGEVPPKFIEDWTKSVGKWEPFSQVRSQ